MKKFLVLLGLLLAACQPAVVTVPVVQTVVVEKEATRLFEITQTPLPPELMATVTEPAEATAEATAQPTAEPTQEPVRVQVGNADTEFARGGPIDEWECSESVSSEGTAKGNISLVAEKDYPTIQVIGAVKTATEYWLLVTLEDGTKCYLNQNSVTLLDGWTFEDLFGVFNR